MKNHQRLLKQMAVSQSLREINFTRSDWQNITRKDLRDATVIVDGLFGTGLSRDLDGRAREVVEMINASRLPVVSIDTPSGIHSDSGALLGVAVHAKHTVTMGFPKLGLLFHPGKTHVGELIIADLGFPDEALQVNSLGIYLLNTAEAVERLPPRPADIHKYQAGTVLLVAGSREYTGAALLAAEAALRSGCGMVYVAVPESIRAVIQTGFREAIVVALPETPEGAVAAGAQSVLEPYLEKADGVVVGPGLGATEETLRFVREFTIACAKPLILDADGVSAFAGEADRLRERTAPTVITPHSGELGRLLGGGVPREPVERVEATRETAQRLGVTLVHKGAPTLIGSADGDVWVNQHGTSALATAGTGDVLSGMVGGLVAQGSSGLDAACVACLLHGKAGVSASAARGERGIIAGDVLEHLGSVILAMEVLAGK
jgi:NAD(P)H-hydrate epimerase